MPPAMPDPGVTVPNDTVTPCSRSLFDSKDRTRCSSQLRKPPAGWEFGRCSDRASDSDVVSGFPGTSEVEGSRTSGFSVCWPSSGDVAARSIDENSVSAVALLPPDRCLMILLTSLQAFPNTRVHGSADPHRRIQPHAHDRSGGKRDVLAVGRRDRAAGADDGTKNRALDAADDAAHDAAHAGARGGHGAFFSDPLALEDLHGRATNVAIASAHRELVERQRQRPVAIDAARLVDVTHDAS